MDWETYGTPTWIWCVAEGGPSRIRPDGPNELVARNIPSAASMCYDPRRHQLVVPMNPNNGLAFVELD